MNLSIVIPNYNGAEILSKNLPRVLDSVKNYTKGKIEIIIPDDPSTDNSKEVINAFISNIQEKHIIGKTISNMNKREAGFSKNVNRGVSLATGDILILLNSDVTPKPHFLEPLLKHFIDETVFAVACMDESIEDGKTILRGRGVGKWSRGFFIHQKGNHNKDNTLWVSCGSGAFRKSMWDRLGGLDTLYNPFYWEDIDISYRALKVGYRLIFEEESVVVHEHERGAIKSKFKSGQVKKVAYRNQFIFIWKNITESKFLISHILWLPYHFIKAISRRDWKFFLGFLEALSKLSQIKESREKARKSFVRADSDILKKYNL